MLERIGMLGEVEVLVEQVDNVQLVMVVVTLQKVEIITGNFNL